MADTPLRQLRQLHGAARLQYPLHHSEIHRLLPGIGQDAMAVTHAYGYGIRIVAAVATQGAVTSLVRDLSVTA